MLEIIEKNWKVIDKQFFKQKKAINKIYADITKCVLEKVVNKIVENTSENTF